MSVKTAYTSHDGFSRKLNVPTSQAVSLPKNYRHYLQSISSATTPSFGSWFTIRISEKGVSLSDIVLAFSTSALSGITVTNSGTAALPSAHIWVDRVDIYHGNQLLESVNGFGGFLINQLTASSDEKRTMANTAAGLYSSHTTRATKSASAGTWFLPLVGPWKHADIPLITSQDLELRIQLRSLADIYTFTSGETASGTAACTINSCNALCTFSRYPSPVLNYTSSLLSKSPLHFGFTDIQHQPFTIASGSTSYSLVLSSITGFAYMIVFAIRSSNPTNNNILSYVTTLSQFEILSSSSENIVGGQPISDLTSRYIQGGRNFNTTFLNDGAGVYAYSHSLDALESFGSNASLSGHQYTGTETLRLTFSSSLGSTSQVDVFAFTHSAIEMGGGNVRKIALSE